MLDYFKAKNMFQKLHKKEANFAASYGLSLVFLQNNNPFHNIDSAVKYAHISYNRHKIANKPYATSGYTINLNTIQNLIDTLADIQFNTCNNINTIVCYNAFLKNNYLASKIYLVNAIEGRDKIELNNAAKANNSDSIKLFITTHPQSKLLNNAYQMLDLQLYEEITQPKSDESYKKFISLYPKSNHINKAYAALINIYKQSKNKEGFYSFIENYPKAPQLNDAWQNLFTLSVKNFTKNELDAFLKTYPSFPFKADVLKELELNEVEFIPAEHNDMFGFVDTAGNFIIKPAYDEVSAFQEGLAIVHKGDSVFFINKENKNTLQKYFSDAQTFFNGLAPVKIKNDWFFIDRMGEIKSTAFEEINEVSENIYIVKKGNLYGAVNAFGEILIEPRYEQLGDFKNQIAYCQLEGKYGFINLSGYIHKPEFEWISEFNENNLAIYKLNNKYGLIKGNGEILTPPNFDLILKGNNNIYVVVKNNLYGFYSGEGCFLSELVYDFSKEKNVNYYTNGFQLKLIKKGAFALTDLNGKTLFDFGTYNEVNFANDGLMLLKKQQKYGYVDQKLNLAIPFKYQTASDFKFGRAIVVNKLKNTLINTKGDELFSTENELEALGNGYFLHENNNLYNLLNKDGKVLIESIKKHQFYKNYLLLYLQNNQIKILPN
ncbi:MAG: WG repeat-containing protein [Bacteroidia bacterium]|nr:WG repeat-containing protein [Bacteroidia bacterium]